jgi:PmbA protein
MTQSPHLSLLEDVLSRAAKAGATAADAMILQSTDLSVSRRLGNLEDLERAESAAIGLRVLVGQRQASISASDYTEQSLQELVERCVAIARLAPEDPHLSLADPAMLAKEVIDLQIEDTSAEPTAEWLLERCAEAEEAALSTVGITNSEGASAHFARHQVSLATSTGFAGSYAQTSCSLSVSVLAGAGTAMERDYDMSLVRFVKDLPDAAALGRSAATKALARLNPSRLKTGQMPVVFDPRVGKSLLGYFLGAISGAAVARGTSFLQDSLGKAVFAPEIEIIDDPLRLGGLASRPFDGEGIEGQKLWLAQEGVLQHWLLDCRSAKQLGLVSNGRAGRGLSAAPSPAATNAYIAAGTVTPEVLIADIAQGFYVTDTFGMGVNLVTGDYSQGAAGFFIEKGKLTYPVSEVTIAGKLQEMFLSLRAANDLTFRYRSNVPTLRVEKMTLAGE